MNEIVFGPDPFWGDKLKTYHTTCADCGGFIRIQSENARNPDGTPRPAPTPCDWYCTSCGIIRLRKTFTR